MNFVPEILINDTQMHPNIKFSKQSSKSPLFTELKSWQTANEIHAFFAGQKSFQAALSQLGD